MRNWIFTPAGAVCYLVLSWTLGVSIALAVRQPPQRPVWSSYCHLHQIGPDRCERLYYARDDVTWLASSAYGYGYPSRADARPARADSDARSATK